MTAKIPTTGKLDDDSGPQPILRLVLLERVACVKLVLKMASDNRSWEAIELATRILERPAME